MSRAPRVRLSEKLRKLFVCTTYTRLSRSSVIPCQAVRRVGHSMRYSLREVKRVSIFRPSSGFSSGNIMMSYPHTLRRSDLLWTLVGSLETMVRRMRSCLAMERLCRMISPGAENNIRYQALAASSHANVRYDRSGSSPLAQRRKGALD